MEKPFWWIITSVGQIDRPDVPLRECPPLPLLRVDSHLGTPAVGVDQAERAPVLFEMFDAPVYFGLQSFTMTPCCC